MDLNKLKLGEQVTYRLPKHDRNQCLDLVYTIQDIESQGFPVEFKTLTYLGMLWTAIQLDDVPRKPRTRAEKAYMYMLEVKLDALLKHDDPVDPDSLLHEEMMTRLKRLLCALQFQQLGEDVINNINASAFKDVTEFTAAGVKRGE